MFKNIPNISLIAALYGFVALVGFSFLTIPTQAANYTQTQTCAIPLQTTNWNNTCNLTRFNPNLGTLQSIHIEFAGNIQSVVRVENRDAAAFTLTSSVQAVITLTRPDNSTLVSVNPSGSESDDLTAYDGVLDFGGSSGITYNQIADSASGVFDSTDPSDLSLFTGTGLINLPVTAVGDSNFTGTANLATQVDTQAGSNVSIIYSYVSQDLSINKSHTGIFTAGTNELYTIVVNTKDNQPTGGTITVVDTLPVGLSFISNTNPDWSCTAVSQILTCTTTASIAANASSSFDIVVAVAQDTASNIVNQAEVSGVLFDPFLSDNNAQDPTTVNHIPTVSNSTISNILNNTPLNIPNNTLNANPNDIVDSISSYTITTLPDPAIGTLFLGNPNSGGLAVTQNQIINSNDIGNLFFNPVANITNSTSFNFRATDSYNDISATEGIITLTTINPTQTNNNNQSGGTTIFLTNNQTQTNNPNPNNSNSAVSNTNLSSTTNTLNNTNNNTNTSNTQNLDIVADTNQASQILGSVLGVRNTVQSTLIRTGANTHFTQTLVSIFSLICVMFITVLLRLSAKK